MSTSSRGIKRKLAHNRNSHTPGRTKGANCVKPKDYGIATKRNHYKGSGIKGTDLNTYDRLWARYRAANK